MPEMPEMQDQFLGGESPVDSDPLAEMDVTDRADAIGRHSSAVPEIAGTPVDFQFLEEAMLQFLDLVGGGQLDTPTDLLAGGALSPSGKATLAGIAGALRGSPYELDLAAGAKAIGDKLSAALADTGFVNQLMGPAAVRGPEEA